MVTVMEFIKYELRVLSYSFTFLKIAMRYFIGAILVKGYIKSTYDEIKLLKSHRCLNQNTT